MIDSQELLRLAATAADYKISGLVDSMIVQSGHFQGGYVIGNDKGGDSVWNPLTDDGDALRLAALLDIDCEFTKTAAYARDGCYCEPYHENKNDKLASVRKVIVRVAAIMGQLRLDNPTEGEFDD